MSDEAEPDVNAAYQLQSSAERRQFYRSWAQDYDDAFAADRGYLLPNHVAEIFAGHAEPEDAPVLDIGAGTGLVGEAVNRHGAWPMDALDLSADMLREAEAKGVYGRCIEADLSDPATLPRQRYGALLSAGTFTFGHLGPGELARILDLARPNALHVISIHAEHFHEAGFAAAFEEISPHIDEPIFLPVPIYASEMGDEHDGAEALIAVFRKARP